MDHSDDHSTTSEEGHLITLIQITSMPDGPDLSTRLSAAFGGIPQRGLGFDIGIEFWVTGTPGPFNRFATAILRVLLDDVDCGRVGIDTEARRRLRTLRANGWEPDLRGICAITGSADTNGQPTPLPSWFQTWVDTRIQRDAEPDRALFADLGRHPVANRNQAVLPVQRPDLRFGYNAGLPDDVDTAWGCRAIIRDDMSLDVPGDRICMVGPDADHLVDVLDDTVGMTWRGRITAMLNSGVMRPDVSAEVIVHQDDRIVIKANTNASHGYVYLCAYFHKASTPTDR